MIKVTVIDRKTGTVISERYEDGPNPDHSVLAKILAEDFMKRFQRGDYDDLKTSGQAVIGGR